VEDQVKFAYEAGLTKRFHTMHVLRTQTIADHSWHVAMLGYILYGQDEPGITVPFLMALLTHDAAEYKVGDVPSPAKRGMAELLKLAPDAPDFFDTWGVMEQSILAPLSMDWDKFLSEEEKRRLALLDAFEGAFYACTERALGNKFVAVAYHNYVKYLGKMLEDCPDVPLDEVPADQIYCHREWKLFDLLQQTWSVADAS
jgi:5'-deoxynucleotidase YfbR-like HD superfamily hydrolase